MIRIIENVITDILKDIIKYIVPSTIFGILSIAILYFLEKIELKRLLKSLKIKFIKDKSYKWKFLFFIYIYFIFDKTLLSRTFGANNNLELALTIPNILEISDTRENIEAIENLIFFIPYTLLLLQGFSLGKLKSMKYILGLSFFTSLIIEVLQYITTLGTFQLSDLLYNTLGGFIGYMIYKIINIKNKGEKNEKKLS